MSAIRLILSRRDIATRFIRPYAQQARSLTDDDRTRNIGIIAHIDAGKTTTTERMLYYSGYTRRIGDVDEGSTVTDFLPAERARGITIQSAAISFSWPPSVPENGASKVLRDSDKRSSISHNINLIDTPGHADFTFEVIRSLRVLDGAVCILDGVAGVEAQTEKVWTQATTYQIPRLVFVNKLDRDGAAFGRTIKEIGARLGVWPAVCGIPWWTDKGQLQGIGDVINMRGLKYTLGGDGKQIEVFDLPKLDSVDPQLATELKHARTAMVELLSEHDDTMVEKYLAADEDHLAIKPIDIIESLRKCTLSVPQTVVPVFAGASFRNIGVQPLLDAVVDLLPSPAERPDPQISLGTTPQEQMSLSKFLQGSLDNSTATSSSKRPKKGLAKERAPLAIQAIEVCALAFKVVADAKRGVLVYVRVYSGSLTRMSTLWNTNLQTSERAQRLMKMFANDAIDVESISAGQIGVIPGLKLARTGDTLIACAGTNPKSGPAAPANRLQLRPIDVPPPVFFVSVEPSSLSEEKHIAECLELLLREDPSLHVSTDPESGQTHLAGMGELHLEIARDRLIQDMKAKARISSIEIGYRETLVANGVEVLETFDRLVGGKSSQASCAAIAAPLTDVSEIDTDVYTKILTDNNRLSIRLPGLDQEGIPSEVDGAALPDHLPHAAVLQALENGTNAALARGPVHGYAMHSTDVTITLDVAQHIFPSTTLASLSSAARQAVLAALKASAQLQESVLMEPLMRVTISVNEESLGAVVHDLSSARGGNVLSLDADDDVSSSIKTLTPAEVNRIYAPPDPFAGGAVSAHEFESASAGGTRQIIARVPLKEMVGYLKHLRSLTAGRGNFTMMVDRFEKMAAQRQRAVLNELRGVDV